LRKNKIVVQKYGGASVSNIEKIKKVAERVAKTAEDYKVVVVVSAMGDTTDKLTALSKRITPNPPPRELDMLLTAGERISMSLLSMAINNLGKKAVSFTGSQVGIVTDTRHAGARILEIRGERLKNAVKKGFIPIIAGFQGVSTEKEVTTLGRGGSDTTAVALAAYLNAERCEIYTDVDGVYTEDPRIFNNVRPLSQITYEELTELSDYGAEVMHPRSVMLASYFNVPLVIKNAFKQKGGTVVKKKTMEVPGVRAIAHKRGLVRFMLEEVPKNPRFVKQAISMLADNKVNIVFYNHGHPYASCFDMHFIVEKKDEKRTEEILKKFKKETKTKRLSKAGNVWGIFLVGSGIGRDPEIFKKAMEIIHKEKIHVEGFFSTDLKVGFFVSTKDAKPLIKRVLKEFGLTKS